MHSLHGPLGGRVTAGGGLGSQTPALIAPRAPAGPRVRKPNTCSSPIQTHAARDDSLATRSGERQRSLEQAPRHELDAPDEDLMLVLELASDEELDEIDRLLNGRSLLSPLVKSLIAEASEPAYSGHRSRSKLILNIEQRFRFLAADALATLRGRWPSYRETLLGIRDRLSVPCPSGLATNDLETEIFLHVLSRHADAVDAMVSEDTLSAAATAQAGDGMASAGRSVQRPNVLQRLLAPLRLGKDEVVPVSIKAAGALAVNNLRHSVLGGLGGQLVRSHAQYEVAMQLLATAGHGGRAAAQVRVASSGLTAAASRYAAARSALSLVGPLMWVSTCLDLARMAIGSDWARVVKVTFALAQIRLTRTHGWRSPEAGEASSPLSPGL